MIEKSCENLFRLLSDSFIKKPLATVRLQAVSMKNRWNQNETVRLGVTAKTLSSVSLAPSCVYSRLTAYRTLPKE